MKVVGYIVQRQGYLISPMLISRGDQELHQLCDRIMSVAMEVTKVSVDVQDKQRQNLLKHVKAALSSDVQSQKLWQMVVKQMTHER